MINSLPRSFTCWLKRLVPCLVLVLFFGPCRETFAQQRVAHLRVRQTASQSLTLIKPTDADFESTLDTYFPGVSQEPGYQRKIRPFLVIVRNDTSTPAVAYAIQWEEHYSDGSSHFLRASFVNVPLMQSVATTYIPSEVIRLISPLFNVTPKGYQWYHSFGRMFPASHFPASNGASSMDVDVDGVVYRGGAFIGPDKTHILQRYVAAHFAARDEALAALKFIQSSTEPQFLVAPKLGQMLDQQIQWKNRAYQFTLLARYVRARGRSAQDLKRILQYRGLRGLETLLQNYINRSGGMTNPSRFGMIYQKLSQNDPRVFGNVHSWIQHQLKVQGQVGSQQK